ncbi:HNH endonuclease [Promicromonospora sukumoe]|uniref:HNH endonuclease n=1 Tax=Promicromonospora sukumoe TaxID=88382 RepID=UPI0037C834CC
MDKILDVSGGPVTAVERSLRRALGLVLPDGSSVAGLEPPPADRAASGEWADSRTTTGSHAQTAAATPCLSWTALLSGDGRAASEVVVTWTGHGRGGHALTDGLPRGAVDVERPGVALPTGDTGSVDPHEADPYEPDDVAEADDLAELPVGARLVAALTAVEVADTDDAALVDVAARWQDVISWATAMQSRATGEIARRRGWTAEHNAAAAEISARLHIPQGDANKLMARGTGLAEHPQVMNALHHATIDTTKADILLRSGNPLSTEERDQAITRYLPQAPDHTRRWLRDKMNQHATHLHGTTETAKHATTRRAVFLDPADNSMAWITANLPATDAATVWDAIEQAAHALRRTPGTTRTLAQARADALVALATGRIIAPPRPECAPDEPSTTPDTGDQSVPRTTVPATGCTCGGCTCGGTAVRVITVKPQIRITVPATMLLGLDNTPGHLDGYGPIPAETAARIATDATWQRLLTDPVTGILTDYSTATYQPGKILRQAVTARDQTCCFPQCDRPARHADLDHIQPYDHQLNPASQPPGARGQTRAHNLQPLCRAHHLAKTHHGWDVIRDPDTGTTTWIAPTGHTHTRPPTQTGPVPDHEDSTARTDATHRTATRDTHTTDSTATATAHRTDPADHGYTDSDDTDITSLAEDVRQLLGRQTPNAQGGTRSPADTNDTPGTARARRPDPGEPPF